LAAVQAETAFTMMPVRHSLVEKSSGDRANHAPLDHSGQVDTPHDSEKTENKQ